MKTEDILTYTALFMAVLLFTMIYASVLIPVLRRYRPVHCRRPGGR